MPYDNENINAVSENTSEDNGEQKKIRGEVNCRKLNLREEASKDSKIKNVLEFGTILTIEEEIGDWFSVCLEDGTNGFVMQEYVKLY